MGENTTTRATIADVVHYEIGLSRTESAKMVDLVFEEISVVLEKGENVKLSGFGTFNLRDKNPRVGRNPKTLEEVMISPRRVMTFTASASLKNAIDMGISKKLAKTKIRKTA
jgi:integration host factor subunit alpha